MRILVLEDDPERMKWFFQAFKSEQLVVSNTASQAIEILKNNTFDGVFLDHDLGLRTFVDSNDPNCGQKVADFMASMNLTAKPKVIVHSYNPAGADAMHLALEKAGFQVRKMPFGTFSENILLNLT